MKTPQAGINQTAKGGTVAAMQTTAGLWIDHRKAVIVFISDQGDSALEIRSNVERQPGRIEGKRSTAPYEAQQVKADDRRQREFTEHLNDYYAAVIAAIRGAKFILLFGPGEAKAELKARLERDESGGRIIDVETADKMTDQQIVAKVRDYFHRGSPVGGSRSLGKKGEHSRAERGSCRG